MSDFSTFYEELQADVIAEAVNSSDGEDFKENAFTKIIVNDLAVAGVLESPTTCHYEATVSGLTLKVNAYSIPDEDSRIDLVITEYFNSSEPSKVTTSDIEKLLNQSLRFFKAAISERHKELEPGSDQHGMLKEICSHKDNIDRIQILLITNGLVVQRKEKAWKDSYENYKIIYDVWDIERLRRFRSNGANHEPIEVDLSEFKHDGIPCVSVSSISEEALGFTSCVSIIPGVLLHDWYDEYGARLLELNVRSYLQARGKINKGILETLIKEPDHFLAYNNGITIVAEQINFNSDKSKILSIKGLQIVNGGQTTASIHKAKKENHADLNNVYVQAKITVVPASEFEEMVPLISRFSNTQNKVNEVDLGANNSYHVGVERVARRTWIPGEQSMWFYERARGSYQTERSKTATTPAQKILFDRKFPASQRVTMEDLARYSNIWNGLPHIVSKGGQKNFTKFMESTPTVQRDWEPTSDEFKIIISKAILYRKTQDIIKELKIPAFKINIANYTVSLLAEKTARRVDLTKIWDRQNLSDALRIQITYWVPKIAEILIRSASTKNPTEWFKSDQCWKFVLEECKEWDVTTPVKSELKRTTDSVKGLDIQSNEIENYIARCMEVDAKQWFEIQVWGSESGKLKDWQIGIANTLAGYSALGWKKQPSEKQASRAIEIMDIYNEHYKSN
ncbi:MAG: AIPR family protein [Methylotenera sp.]|uniref:AIPR family protein n=1 Tax=Methylotenera sp. TaxID=2051956 RepID=UPI00273285E5|nr:AIPR family protein [Methylotenera sp.]MDP2102096.1 AIPR family protein [Methylotenera sp.]MDP2281056.1 AIPR family protein [Methylotenera sp.]MDP3061151.1 AIPR family protein [Methylotenera sp.]MDP3210920.1 AIPR family protein [Methylotenera sp.]